VPHVVGPRISINVAIDWTEFDADGQATLMLADSNEGGHLFQSDPGHHSNLMAASLVSSRGPVLVMSWRRSPGQVFAEGLG